MNSKSLRRLAADHASLHTAGLPPNYLFPPANSSHDSSSDLTSLDVLLAGPVGTAFSSGVWKLHLSIPPTYPAAPPTATFKTRIWHPNIEESTGAVCVETLKRDWSDKLRLRDVLVTISCLLIQPNPASALNAEAGRLAAEDWEGFCRRARLMAGIHAGVPKELEEGVREAQMRGEEKVEGGKGKGKEKETVKEGADTPKSKLGRQGKLVQNVAEEEENFRQRGRTVDVESDPESDWIPGPAKTATDPFAPNCENVFGIRTGLPAALDGEDSMGVDAANVNRSVNAGLPVPKWAPYPSGLKNGNNHEDPVTSSSGGTSCLATAQSLRFSTPPLSHAAAINNQSSSEQQQHTDGPLKFTHLNPFAPVQVTARPRADHYLAEFSWSWADAEVVHETGTIMDGPGKAEVIKRLKGPEEVGRMRWEVKRFKMARGSLGRYNRGLFGPRTGLGRL
ncbi:UBC-like protein [Lepidopterella palustris CBS 459.81]|uniref:UBC-like protein n=1 Tax=Lepidopterella palustris CBS 459.81 TaxID=1314670 RepID=A0A8E2E3G6_9PEZI|nr:UBC-like protein [Lepidopterella palustris CBS 459.81]